MSIVLSIWSLKRRFKLGFSFFGKCTFLRLCTLNLLSFYFLIYSVTMATSIFNNLFLDLMDKYTWVWILQFAYVFLKQAFTHMNNLLTHSVKGTRKYFIFCCRHSKDDPFILELTYLNYKPIKLNELSKLNLTIQYKTLFIRRFAK